MSSLQTPHPTPYAPNPAALHFHALGQPDPSLPSPYALRQLIFRVVYKWRSQRAPGTRWR
jgi:hypothetical protein